MGLGVWLCAGLLAGAAVAQEKEPPRSGPGAGAGQRKVDEGGAKDEGGKDAKPDADGKDAKPDADGKDAKPDAKPEPGKPPPVDHKQGPAPRRPSPTLPKGAQGSAADPATRRALAEGPVRGQPDLDDEEIQALVAADQVLFKRPLAGATPGWSWGLPQKSGPRTAGAGVPPQGALTPGQAPEAAHAGWLAQLTMPNFEVRLDPRVITYLEFYKSNPRGQAIAKVWAKKAGRYAPALMAELAKSGLPTDLVWLSLIESGHNPTIYSSAGAAGLWQFIPDSGRMYGLTVDRWVDERLDPERSTQAAIRYLSDLRTRFGNWELAMAAYNMGHGGLSRAIRKYNTNDFWELSRYEAGVPWETALYVPKIGAIAIVMNNKRVFGLDNIEPDPREKFDVVEVPQGVTLADVAAAAKRPKAEVEALNPHYLASRVPPAAAAGEKATPATWRVKLPRGSGKQARTGLAHVARIDAKYEPYAVRFGDTLEQVAADVGLTEQALRTLNGAKKGERLQAGEVLLVPKAKPAKRTVTEQLVAVVPPRQFSYPGRRRVFYTALAGDSLEAVAAAFEVSRAELITWNGLDTSARLLTGMVLQLFVKPSFDLGQVRVADQPLVLTAGSEEFFAHFEGKEGRQRLRVTVQPGDTLTKIGQRYGMSVGMMERINRIARSKVLKPGETLIVYAKAGVGAKSAEDSQVKREELPKVDEAAAPERSEPPPLRAGTP